MYPLLLSDFNKTQTFLTDFRKKRRKSWNIMSPKFDQWETRCSMRTDGWTETTKLIVAFRDFVNTPGNRAQDSSSLRPPGPEHQGTALLRNVTTYCRHETLNDCHLKWRRCSNLKFRIFKPTCPQSLECSFNLRSTKRSQVLIQNSEHRSCQPILNLLFTRLRPPSKLTKDESSVSTFWIRCPHIFGEVPKSPFVPSLCPSPTNATVYVIIHYYFVVSVNICSRNNVIKHHNERISLHPFKMTLGYLYFTILQVSHHIYR